MPRVRSHKMNIKQNNKKPNEKGKNGYVLYSVVMKGLPI